MQNPVNEFSRSHCPHSEHSAKSVLVLGGYGFIGRYTVKALQQRGAHVLIGTRGHADGQTPHGERTVDAKNERCVVLHHKTTSHSWNPTLEGVDVVINTVGILRERRGESFEAVHHLALEALASACKRHEIPLIHMSALGIDGKVHNANTESKLRGEKAIIASKCAGVIVRTSVVDAPDGYGSGWLHRVANWPVWLVPAGAKSLLSPIDANDAGEALATMAIEASHLRGSDVQERADSLQCVEIGCGENYTLDTYLAKLRDPCSGRRPEPLLIIKVPQAIARLFAHIFDVLHITPYSIGHHELLEHDNVPTHNQLPAILGKAPRPIGADPLRVEDNSLRVV